MKIEIPLIMVLFIVFALIIAGALIVANIINSLEDQLTVLESKPITVTVTETVEVPTVEYVPQVEYVTETVYAEPVMFENVEQLEDWLDGWEYVHPIVSGESIFNVSDKNDCDDKALQMVSDMASDGYIGGVAHDYTNYDTPHMLVCVPINNEVYFVEPTTKDISRELDGHWFVLD